MVKTNKRMTDEEMRIQEEHDYQIVKQEIEGRNNNYTVTRTDDYTCYDAVIDKDVDNTYLEIKERWETNSTDYPYYLINKDKVDNLRRKCKEDYSDGYIAYLLKDCFYLFDIQNCYTTEEKEVNNPIKGKRTEINYRLFPSTGKKFTYLYSQK